MTEEERAKLAEKAMEEERRREAQREKEPEWKLYCIMDGRLNKDFGNNDYLQKIISEAFENDCTGDEKDRWTFLQQNFELK